MNGLFLFVIFLIALVMALLVGFFVGLTFGEQLLPIAKTALVNMSVTT